MPVVYTIFLSLIRKSGFIIVLFPKKIKFFKQNASEFNSFLKKKRPKCREILGFPNLAICSNVA